MRHSPRVFLLALVTTTAIVSAVLCTAGWLLLNQQREIDERRARAALDGRADLLAGAVRSRLADAGDRLSAWLADPTSPAPRIADATLLTIDGDRVSFADGQTLPFVPVVHADSGLSRFVAGEQLEHRDRRLEAAADAYRSLAADADPGIRAGAMQRLSRVLRKAGQPEQALRVSASLAEMPDVTVGEVPASLAGQVGRFAALESLGRPQEARAVADSIQRDLDRGRWRVLRGDAEAYRERFGSEPPPASWHLAAALTDTWQSLPSDVPARGHKVVPTSSGQALVMWRASGSRASILVAFTEVFLGRVTADSQGWRLTGDSGPPLTTSAAGPAAVERLVSAEYPWKVEVSSSVMAQSGAARNLILTLLSLALVFVWGTTYVMARAIRKEARLSQLQADFVATVSHEFRSPLTTMRQVTETLEDDRLPADGAPERRRAYYELLSKETARLQGLVETLLNFGRMDAGVEQYRRDPVDVSALVQRVVTGIQPQAQAAGMSIEVSDPTGGVTVRGDEQALAIALRNLLDNAVKYGRGTSMVRVELAHELDRLAIRVIDSGAGIPPEEQQLIFQKFARGSSAARGHVGGTGLGLAMVRHIASAHGGDVRLKSQVGQGSTFSILLPVEKPL